MAVQHSLDTVCFPCTCGEPIPEADGREVCSMRAFIGIMQVDEPKKIVNRELYMDEGELGLSEKKSLLHFPLLPGNLPKLY